MGYKVVSKSHPEFESGIMEDFDINSETEICCPNCDGGPMLLVENGIEEQYMFDGTMERTERYYCEDCNAWADVTQVFWRSVILTSNQEVHSELLQCQIVQAFEA